MNPVFQRVCNNQDRVDPHILNSVLELAVQIAREGREDASEHASPWGTIKEPAQIDGAFVVSTAGAVLSAARFFEATTREVHVPLGLGTRHIAAAGMSMQTRALCVVVSESSLVRVFKDGSIAAEIYPEMWLFRSQPSQISGRRVEETDQEQVMVVSQDE